MPETRSEEMPGRRRPVRTTVDEVGTDAQQSLGGRRPRLSIVVPVFNQAASIVANLQVIRERVSALEGEVEIVVVSDGSIDQTEETLLASVPDHVFRVYHYDRNLGKGYAIRTGALEATGRWIAFVDADLDLDPADIPAYVERAEEYDLDFAIGSKRHPDSQVAYPRVRVAASWLFQQLVRLLFQLDVRDTQVGLKVFRREIAEQVMPLLLVKRYAFDIELLAVSRAFGFARIEEMPVRLDYRFAGSGVRSRAVLRALIDTVAIFYRLRLLRYYQRRRAIGGAFGWTRPRENLPFVSVLAPGGVVYRELSYPETELVNAGEGTRQELHEAAVRARGDVLAVIEPDARPSANWLSATVPFLVRSEIAAVVVPKLAPLGGTVRERAAAAIVESRIGAGLGFIRYTPGNIRYVTTFPTRSLVIRREDLLALPPDLALPDIIAELSARGRRVLYSPDAVIVADPPPLFVPHLLTMLARACTRGHAARRGRLRLAHPVYVTAVIGAAAVLAAAVEIVPLAVVLGGLYLAAVLVAAAVAALRHRSTLVGALTAVGIPVTHVFYAAGFVAGLFGACGS